MNPITPKQARKSMMNTTKTPKRSQSGIMQTPGSTRKSRQGSMSNLNTTQSTSDRFIPTRSAMNLDLAHYNLMKEDSHQKGSAQTSHTTSTEDNAIHGFDQSPSRQAFSKTLFSNMFGPENAEKQSKILAFKKKAPQPKIGYLNQHQVLYTQHKSNLKQKKQTRHIPQVAEKVLDAPDIMDDYYLNLLDWSNNNMLAVALQDAVYLWNANSGETIELMHTSSPDTYVSSLSWVEQGDYLAIGTSDSVVELWDVEQSKQLRRMRGHQSRVSALSWNKHILSSGSRDSTIQHHDVRVAQHLVGTLQAHAQEVCGLKWSPDGQQLASGGNDNMLHIWDIANQSSPRFSFNQHQAAVKALAWCPWQSNLLASGGGTADRCIRFWNTQTGGLLNTIDTHSQVCAIQWSTHYRELISSHGFSQNQLILWSYPHMTKMAEFHGHSQRVLHMALSPDGTTVASAAADETLRFWKAFEVDQIKKTSASAINMYNTNATLLEAAKKNAMSTNVHGQRRAGHHCVSNPSKRSTSSAIGTKSQRPMRLQRLTIR